MAAIATAALSIIRLMTISRASGSMGALPEATSAIFQAN
jgi:hypothetical protein